MRGLMRKRDGLLKRLGACSEFVRGSINSVCAACNRARCICDKRTLRKAYRLTYKDSQQRTRIIYIPRSRLGEIRKMITNYAKSRRIIEQLIETNILLFKKGPG